MLAYSIIVNHLSHLILILHSLQYPIKEHLMPYAAQSAQSLATPSTARYLDSKAIEEPST